MPPFVSSSMMPRARSIPVPVKDAVSPLMWAMNQYPSSERRGPGMCGLGPDRQIAPHGITAGSVLRAVSALTAGAGGL
jgi:hypothetical protein